MTPTYKHHARIAGLLILLATATFIPGSALLESAFSNEKLLAQIQSNPTPLILGVLLEYVDAFAVVGVAVFLYPLVNRLNATQAIGYITTRVIEGVLLLVGGIAPLMLIPLSVGDIALSGAMTFETVTTLASLMNTMSFQAAMLALGIGSVPFCWFLFTEKLIPGWMALSGVVGYAALAASAVLAVSGYESLSLYLYIPGALFEIVFPFWLIFKGLGVPDQPTPATNQPYLAT